MAAWITVARSNALAPGEWIKIELEQGEALLFNVDGAYYAVEDLCTHDGGPLSDGTVEGCSITCPRHGARFDLRSGEVLAPPAYEAIHVFPVRLNGDTIEVMDDR